MSTQDGSGRFSFARVLRRGPRRDDDFSEELKAHIDLETERLVGEGMTVADARSAALRAFGNVTVAKERFYEANRWSRICVMHFETFGRIQHSCSPPSSRLPSGSGS